MRNAGFSAVMRFTMVLASGSPSTIAWRPPRSAFAAASLSRRSGIFLATASGPWQVKHLSERIGRTSRLKSTGLGIGSVADTRHGEQNYRRNTHDGGFQRN